jgi:hypothetical protein
MRIGASTANLFAPRLPRSRSAHRGNRATLLPAASVVWRPSLGTAGDDRLKGRRAADVIVGGKGVDEIYGLNGDDLICGGFGYEIIPNDDLADFVVGDRIFAGPGHDRVRGIPIGRHRHHPSRFITGLRNLMSKRLYVSRGCDLDVPFSKEALCLLRPQWLRKVIALSLITDHRPQLRKLLRRFDALRDGL